MAQVVTPPQSEEALQKGFDLKLSKRLAGYLRPYGWPLIASLLLMIFNAASAVAGPYLVGMAVDQGLQGGSLSALRTVVLLYLLTVFVQWLSIYLRVNIMARVAQGFIYDLRQQLFEHLQQLSLGFFSRYSVGRVITRVVNDVEVIREFINWAVLAIARDLFALIGIFVAMLTLNLRLSLLAFTVLPIMAWVTVAFRKRARENYREVRSAISWVNSVLAENINGVRVVQAFSRQEHNYANFRDEVNRNNLNKQLKAARVAASFPAAIEFLSAATIALVVWVGGVFAFQNVNVSGIASSQVITPGVLIAFVLYITRFFEPIRDLSARYDSLQSTMASSERVFALMDTPVEVQDLPAAIELPQIRGEVVFDQVSFNYSDDPTPVLLDIQIKVRAGETVALVGKTGAGKSTLIKLLCRFHDPVIGAVKVDGIDLRQVTQHSLRSQMGIVLQDPFLFNGTIADNIRFSRQEASETEVIAAAQAVGAHEFILRLPGGYESVVGEGGVVLSVGQRQLISFARALLADPRILVLDEATSSVDTQTERIIQNALARLLKGRTAFVIAHRLSTVINADRILVIQDGRIVEEGTHSELLAHNGLYYALYSQGFEEPI